MPSIDRPAGVTPWEPSASVSEQLRAASELHASAASGTAAILLPDRSVRAEEISEWLQLAWKKTAVSRLRFIRLQPSQRQLPVTLEEAASQA